MNYWSQVLIYGYFFSHQTLMVRHSFTHFLLAREKFLGVSVGVGKVLGVGVGVGIGVRGRN